MSCHRAVFVVFYPHVYRSAFVEKPEHLYPFMIRFCIPGNVHLMFINCLCASYEFFLRLGTRIGNSHRVPLLEPSIQLYSCSEKPSAHIICDGAIQLRVLVHSDAVNQISQRKKCRTDTKSGFHVHRGTCRLLSINGPL